MRTLISSDLIHPAIQLAIDDQLVIIANVQAIVTTAAAAIAKVYDCESVNNPQIDRALKLAGKLLDGAYGQLGTDTLQYAPKDAELIARVAELEASDD